MTQANTQLAENAAPPWRVLLDGCLLTQAQQAIAELADSLQVTAENYPASVLADIALFYGYLAQANHAAEIEARALNYLNAAINSVAASATKPYFIGGYPQVGWAITQLAGKLFAPEETEICQPVDETLLAHLQNLRPPTSYDLISGLTGHGLYALARLPEARALECLQLVLARLSEYAERSAAGVTWFTAPGLLPEWQRQICPNGYYNLGVAHGVPGVIAFLARASAVEAVRQPAQALLTDAVRWLTTHLSEAGGAPFFPAWLAPEIAPERERLTWCYGDLGGATALLYAACCVEQPEWEALALRVLRAAAVRREQETNVLDAGLCHGAAGNAHLFNRIYQATGAELFREAARYWYARIFDFRQTGIGLAGFAAFRPQDDSAGVWVENASLLDGAAGVGLALLAASSNVTPSWDECLLVSLPARPSSL